jgi:hypothetical protein
MAIWNIFSVFVCCYKGNLATLLSTYYFKTKPFIFGDDVIAVVLRLLEERQNVFVAPA